MNGVAHPGVAGRGAGRGPRRSALTCPAASAGLLLFGVLLAAAYWAGLGPAQEPGGGGGSGGAHVARRWVPQVAQRGGVDDPGLAGSSSSGAGAAGGGGGDGGGGGSYVAGVAAGAAAAAAAASSSIATALAELLKARPQPLPSPPPPPPPPPPAVANQAAPVAVMAKPPPPATASKATAATGAKQERLGSLSVRYLIPSAHAAASHHSLTHPPAASPAPSRPTSPLPPKPPPTPTAPKLLPPSAAAKPPTPSPKAAAADPSGPTPQAAQAAPQPPHLPPPQTPPPTPTPAPSQPPPSAAPKPRPPTPPLPPAAAAAASVASSPTPQPTSTTPTTPSPALPPDTTHLLVEQALRLQPRMAAAARLVGSTAVPPPPEPIPKHLLTSRCAALPAGGPAAAPGYHLVVLGSPRAQQGRYLASTLLGAALADARPTSLTLLWAEHAPPPPTAAEEASGAAGSASAGAGPGPRAGAGGAAAPAAGPAESVPTAAAGAAAGASGGARAEPASGAGRGPGAGAGTAVAGSTSGGVGATGGKTMAEQPAVAASRGPDAAAGQGPGPAGPSFWDDPGVEAVPLQALSLPSPKIKARRSLSGRRRRALQAPASAPPANASAGSSPGATQQAGAGVEPAAAAVMAPSPVPAPAAAAAASSQTTPPPPKAVVVKSVPAPAGPSAGPKPGPAVPRGSSFSLLENLRLYERGPGGPTPGPRRDRERPRAGPGGAQAAGAGAGAGGRPVGALPPIRVRYLPQEVRVGDVLANYYQVFHVPDQVAEEEGNEALRELPLLVIEADVLLAPHFAQRMACLLRMLRALPAAVNSSAPPSAPSGPSGPDYAVSLYNPGMVPQPVGEVMAKFPAAFLRGPSGAHTGPQGAKDEGGRPGQGPAAPSVRASVSAGAGPGAEGAEGRLTLVPERWSWGSQGLLYSPGVRRSLMAHYREVMAGCAGQDGLQDIELVRHLQRRGCAGIPPLPPPAGAPTASGPACEPARVHGPRAVALGVAGPGAERDPGARNETGGDPNRRCYLLTLAPALVQHVGASSALFGAVSQRFHVATSFGTAVAVPGLDGEGAW
ncbi:hypothetical protein HYH03_015529 [Edaphochlamys debaryana]|uniref:Uncharacterized protein n=1 Tax=Edaphochlamys debaryana TaxID=47281 RepID=A0A835XLR0_9CHLO|nr:hypothetical protein HYH03_015529 [Edaphochlamys debaryana]|eukprot:KAG2485819.1 hypothetical protein HYH03_015529 [Edaphochlamys debaryana]